MVKKLLVLIALASSALPASSADYRRVDYAGYRVGDSVVKFDESRVSGLPSLVNVSDNINLAAAEVNGQKLVRWWAYQSRSHTGYSNVVNVAGAVYSFNWTYGTTSYSPTYLVVDYDYIKYNLSYNANGGSGDLPSSQSGVVYTNEVGIAGGGLSKTGYTWECWTNSLTNAVWQAGDTVTGESLGLRSIVDGKSVVLYAKWTANSYDVTLDLQGGAGGTSSVSATYDSAMPSATMPTRKGYVFGGYYTAVNGGGTQYYTAEGESARNWNVASNTTLYAKWTDNMRTVELDWQGGSNGDPSVVATFGQPMPPATMPERMGYTFDGYYSIKNGGGDKYYNNDGTSARDWDIDDSRPVLYANWKPIQYKVDLDHQGGSNGTESVTAKYDEVMPQIQVPIRHGYDFGGYYTAVGGDGTQYYAFNGTSARKWDMTASTTLYAKWTAKTSTVTLDRQGGSGGTSSVRATYDSAMPSATMPTRTGYAFGGYYDAANGGGTQYYTAAGESVQNWNVASNATLYAKWTAKEYSLVVNPNGGVYQGSSEPVAKSPKLVFESGNWWSIGVPARFGYAFAGWYTAATGGTMVYGANGERVTGSYWNENKQYIHDGDLTVYARWTAKTYAVTLDKQGGTGGGDSVTATYDSAMPSATMPTRTGYTFGGYYDAANGGGTQYYKANGASARSWNVASNATLYAKWTAKTYNFTRNPNGGTLNGSSSAVTISSDAQTPLTYGKGNYWTIGVPVRTGYTFEGWFTTASGGTKVYGADGKCVPGDYWNEGKQYIHDGNLTVYAHWSATTYTVTLDKQGGTGGSGSVTATYDSAMPSAAVPTRTGYTFGGYYDAANGGGAQYYRADGTSAKKWDKASATTLYAKWTAKTYAVTLNKQDGTGGRGSVTATYDAAMPSATMPTRTGYAFGGYYDAANGGGTQYYKANGASARSWNIASNATLYAKWTANEYTLVVNPNGGVYQGSSEPVTKSPKLIFDSGNWWSIGVATRIGYNFDGWYTAASGGTEVYGANGECVPGSYWRATSPKRYIYDGDLTVYAHWTANEYAVSFSNNCSEASGTMLNESFRYDEAKALGSNAFERVGYTFAGWATSADGQVEYTDGQVVSNLTTTANGAVPLFAKWTPNEYEVSFSNNWSEAGGTMPNEPFRYDEAKALSSNAFERAGYVFAGWATNSSAEAAYTDGQVVSNLTAAASGLVQLYATWSELRFVAFDGHGADDPSAMAEDVMTFVGAETQALVSNKFAKTGYTFAGWATNETAAAALDFAYTNGQETVGTNLWMGAGETNVLYAVWNTNTYTVAFNANGVGTGTMDDQTFVYDQEQMLTKRTFESTLAFLGWATNSTGDVVFGDEVSVTNLTAEAGGKVTLYAVWDNGDLSKAMHCDNLYWESSINGKTGTNEWKVVEGAGEGYNPSGSSVFCTVQGAARISCYLKPSGSSSGGGRISFWYKMSRDDAGVLHIYNQGVTQSISPCTEWRQYYSTVSDEDLKNIKIDFQINQWADQKEPYTVWIDQMTWVPDGAEPTEDDKPTITGFTATEVGFRLAVDGSNISDSFGYQILATNELVVGDWPVKTNLTAEALKAGYDIVPEEGEPTMFYKVKVVPK